MSAAGVGGANGAALVLQPDAGLSGGLSLGQLVQARVLRHLDAGRYLVRLAGQERVVESGVALHAEELMSLRVVGTRERIELERVEREPAAPQSAAQANEDLLSGLGGGRVAVLIEEVFRRYRGTLEPQAGERLLRLASRAQKPERMALAGLVISKLGLPMEADVVEPVYRAIDARSGALAELTETDADAEAGDSGKGAPRWWPPAQAVLNAQVGGTVAHRVGMLPLQFGGTVIEVEVALFEEHDDAQHRGPAAAQIKHRKLVLAFETEQLGRVELRAAMAERHIRVALVTESSASTNALLRQGESLARALAQAGWEVDEISHETRAGAALNGVVNAAVEHLITPGSLSALV